MHFVPTEQPTALTHFDWLKFRIGQHRRPLEKLNSTEQPFVPTVVPTSTPLPRGAPRPRVADAFTAHRDAYCGSSFMPVA